MKHIAALFIFLVPILIFSQDVDWDDDDILILESDTGITIVGTSQTTQDMAVIGKDEIENRNAPDLPALLQEALDLNITNYGAYGNQSGLSVRGFDSKRVAILIDGVPVNSSMDGKFDFNQIDLDSVERIEVIYGGSDSKYNVSGAMGGVINIITVKKQKQGWQIGVSVSNTSYMPDEYTDRGVKKDSRMEDLIDTQNYTLSTAYGGDIFSFSANLFANNAGNHYIYTDYQDNIRRKESNEVWDTGAAASFIWELPDLSKLIASSKFYYGDKNIPASGFAWDCGRQNDLSVRQSVMLDMPRAFHDDFAAEASIAWNFGRLEYTPPGGTTSRHNQQGLLFINRWNWYPGNLLTLRSGIDYKLNLIDSTEVDNHSRHDGGLYLTLEWKPIEQLMIIPSVKGVITSSNAPEAIPKLGFLWNITDSFALRNNYFRCFSYPVFEDLFWAPGGGVAGNPDLNPEDGWGSDLGITWNMKNLMTLESAFFAQWLKDSIHWAPGRGGIWRPENVGEAAFFGLDSKLGFEIPVSIGPIKKISPSVTYKYLRSYLLSFGYTYDSDKRIPYTPEHTAGGSLDIFWGTGSMLISGHFESLRYIDRPNITLLNPFFLLNIHINQDISKNFSMFISGRNLLNTPYESFYGYPLPGINLTFGMKFKFENIGRNREK